MLRNRRQEAGFSLVEVLISAVVLGFGVMGIISLYTSTARGMGTSRARAVATQVAVQQMELVSAASSDIPECLGVVGCRGSDTTLAPPLGQSLDGRDCTTYVDRMSHSRSVLQGANRYRVDIVTQQPTSLTHGSDARIVSVSVCWQDRTGNVQQVMAQRLGPSGDAMRAERGLTLVELMVSMAISAVLIAAAMTLVGGHTRLLSSTSDRVDMYQEGRRVASVLSRDLRHAGVGIGYQPDGTFAGLSRGNFNVVGGATFTSNDLEISVGKYTVPTDDLGIRIANGDFRTIADFNMTSGQMCAGGMFENGDTVVLGSREGMSARTVKIDGLSAQPCQNGECLGGCMDFTYIAVDDYVSDAYALTTNYSEGVVYGDFQHIVWYISPRENGGAFLNRASITSDRPCASREAGCGGAVAINADTLQIAIFQWDSTTEAWVDRTNDPAVDGDGPLRIDIELVVRGEDEFDQGIAKTGVPLELAPGRCIPDCEETPKDVNRWAVRTSVEIRNAGKMRLM